MLYAIHDTTHCPATSLGKAMADLRALISKRIETYFNGEDFDLQRWAANNNNTVIKEELIQYLPQLKSIDEWIILVLAIVPHLQPELFSSVISEQLPAGGDFPEFGGVKGTNHRGLLPTGETAQFIIGGKDLKRKMELQQLFSENHFFYENDILYLEPVREGEPFMSGRIIISAELVHLLITGKKAKPKFNLDFPAKLTTTKMTWEDLILHPYTAEQIEDIKRWVEHHNVNYRGSADFIGIG